MKEVAAPIAWCACPLDHRREVQPETVGEPRVAATSLDALQSAMRANRLPGAQCWACYCLTMDDAILPGGIFTAPGNGPVAGLNGDDPAVSAARLATIRRALEAAAWTATFAPFSS